MTTVAWWHPFSGIAGDMALASLVDAGAELDQVVAGLGCLPVRGWHVEAHKTTRAGLVATHLVVTVDAGQDVVERTWGTIRHTLQAAAGLPERARQRAERVFACLARAEGLVHGVAPEDVHFHEVGGLDALVDVVGTCLALECLDVGVVYAGSVAVGTGTVRGAHGALPNPAPAVVRLLTGAPVHGTAEGAELTTPTGAALLAGLATAFGPLPPMKVTASGYGAGRRDLGATPNVLQVVVGELEVPSPGAPHDQPGRHQKDLVVLEVNVDDVTGEVLAHTVAGLMDAGALDAWLVPTVAKKGRPGYVVSALAEPAGAGRLADVILAETGALGFRQHHVARWALERQVVNVDVEGQPVGVKVGPHRWKAEYGDCARAAARLGWSLSEVARRAEDAARGLGPAAP